LAHGHPEDGIFLYVRVVSLTFICIWLCAFGQFNEQIHWSKTHTMDNSKPIS